MSITKHIHPFAAPTADNTNCASRRHVLIGAAALIAATAGGTMLPGPVLAQAKKSPQKLVKYQTTPKLNRKCADCTFFLPDKKECKVVAGTIDPNGWCLRWAKKKA